MFNYHSGLAWGRFWWKSLNPIWVILCQILPSNNCYFCLFNKKMVVPFLGPKMAPMGSKITQYCPKWLRCLESDIRNQLHQISACLAIVLRCHKTSLRQFCVWALKWLLMAPKWHKMAWNDMNSLELSSETISIGFLLLLRSFWVVTWPVYDNFEFLGQNWPKMAEKGFKWPKMAWMSEKWHPKPFPLDFCSSCGHFEWSHD